MRHPYSSRPITVEAGPRGRPLAVAGIEVEQVREEWLVEDGWWTKMPLRRHYFELVLDDGRNVVVYRDASGTADSRQGAPPEGVVRREKSGRWYLQRA